MRNTLFRSGKQISYETVKNATDFGISADSINIDFEKISARKEKITKRLRMGVQGLLKAHGVTLIRGFGRLLNRNEIEVGENKICAEKIVLATGSAPIIPPIPGIESKKVMTSDQVLLQKSLARSLVIIGGGVIGIEFATLFSAFLKEVTVLEMMPSILPGVDADIIKSLSRSLSKKGVSIITKARVLSIGGEDEVSVTYECEGETRTLTAEDCIVCVGRRPRTEDIGLENVGIDVERRFIKVDDSMQTNVENIYAIGDITGKIQLAHVASAQGFVAAANCAGRKRTMNYDNVPFCIYTEPEIAYIGMTAEKAQALGREIIAGSFSAVGNGRCLIMGESDGMVKIIADEDTREILGAQIFAARATDMISEIALAMNGKLSIDDLADTIHPHPTISEMIMEASHDAEGLCCHAVPKR